MASKTLQVIITGDAAGAKRAFKEVEGGSAQAETKVKGIGTTFAKVAAGFGAIRFFKGVFAEAEEAQKTTAQVAAVIKSTGGVAHVTAGQIDTLANSLSKKAGVDDELIAHGAAVLLTFTNVRNEVGKGNDVFNQATQAALDMSSALGKDMQGASISLGKALNDPIKGISALTRVGVSFTAQQKEQVKTLVQSGNILGAQKVILGEVKKEFGGAAEANATAAGKMKVAFANLQESVGGALAPAFEKIVGVLSKVLEGFSSLPSGVQTGIVAFASLAGAAAYLVPKVKDAIATFSALGRSVADNAAKMTTAGIAVGAIGVAIAGAVIVWNGMQQSSRSVAAGIKSMTEEVKSSGKTVKEVFSTTIADAVAKGGEWIDLLHKQGFSTREFADALRGSEPAFKRFKDSIKEKFGDKMGPQADYVIAKLNELHKQSIGTTEGLKATARAGRDVGTGAASAGAGLGTAASRAKEFQTASDTLATAQQALKTAVDAVGSAIKQAFVDRTSISSTAIAAQAAVDSLTAAMLKNGATLNFDSEAGRNNKTAFIGLGSAATDAAVAVFNQTQNAELARGVLTNYSNTLGVSARAAGFTAAQVFGLRTEMGLTPEQIATQFLTPGAAAARQAAIDVNRAGNDVERTRNMKVLADTIEANRAIDWAARTRNAWIDVDYRVQPGLPAGSLGAAGVQVRASGGPVSAGRPYIVGEHRPELFVPSTSGRIMPRVGGSGGGGGGDTIVHVHGSVLSERNLVDVIARARRRGLPA